MVIELVPSGIFKLILMTPLSHHVLHLRKRVSLCIHLSLELISAGTPVWINGVIRGWWALWTVAAVVAVVVVVAVAEAAVHYPCWVVPVCNQE